MNLNDITSISHRSQRRTSGSSAASGANLTAAAAAAAAGVGLGSLTSASETPSSDGGGMMSTPSLANMGGIGGGSTGTGSLSGASASQLPRMTSVSGSSFRASGSSVKGGSSISSASGVGSLSVGLFTSPYMSVPSIEYPVCIELPRNPNAPLKSLASTSSASSSSSSSSASSSAASSSQLLPVQDPTPPMSASNASIRKGGRNSAIWAAAAGSSSIWALFNVFMSYMVSPITVIQPLINLPQQKGAIVSPQEAAALHTTTHSAAAASAIGSSSSRKGSIVGGGDTNPSSARNSVDAKTRFTSAVSSIKALSRMMGALDASQGGGDDDSKRELRPDLQVITGYVQGGLELRNVDQGVVQGSAYFMHKIRLLCVTNSLVYIVLETNSKLTKDNCDIFVRELNSLDKAKYRFSGHSEEVTCVIVSQYNESIFVSGSLDRTVLIWSLWDPLHPIICNGHSMMVTALAFVQKDQYVCSGSSDATVRVWAMSNGAPYCVITGHMGPVRYLAEYLDQGQIISACGGGWIKISTLKGKHVTLEHLSQSPILCGAYHGRLLVVGGMDEKITFLNSETGEKVVISGHNAPIRTLHIDPIRMLLLSTSDDGLLVIWDYSVLLNSPPTPGGSFLARQPTARIVSRPHQAAITNVLVKADPLSGQWQRVLTSSADHMLSIIDFDIARNARVFALSGTVLSVESFRKGWMVSASHADSKLVLWDLPKMQPKSQRMQLPHPQISAMTFLPTPGDGSPSYLLSSTRTGSVKVWCIEAKGDSIDNRYERTTAGPVVALSNILRRASDSIVAVVCNFTSTLGVDKWTVEILSVPTCQELCLISNFAGTPPVLAVHLVHAGLLTYMRDGGIYLYNIKTGRLDGTLVSSDQVKQHINTATLPIPPGPVSDRKPAVKLSMAMIGKDFSPRLLSFGSGDARVLFGYGLRVELWNADSEANKQQQQLALEAAAAESGDFSFSASTTATTTTTTTTTSAAGELASLATPGGKTIDLYRVYSQNFPTPVTCVSFVEYAELYAAIGMDDGRVQIVNQQLQVILDIRHDGDTKTLAETEADLLPTSARRTNAVTDPRRRRSYINMSMASVAAGLNPPATPMADGTSANVSNQLEPPAPVTVISSYKRDRYILIGFADGVVLVWDMSQRRTARRIHAFIGQEIAGLALFLDDRRFVSWTSENKLRMDMIEHRSDQEALAVPVAPNLTTLKDAPSTAR